MDAGTNVETKTGSDPSNRTCRVGLPAIFHDPEMLLPVKIDITLKGGRYVDTMCVNIKSTAFDIYELCWQTCSDLNLASGFLWRMYLQLREQIIAFRDIVGIFLSLNELPEPNFPDVSSLQAMTVAIRNNTTDYSDKFTWDMSTPGCAPEDFARITCSDLGLPPEMEAAISHRIRENVIRYTIPCILVAVTVFYFLSCSRTFLSWFEDIPTTATSTTSLVSPQGIKAPSILSPVQFIQ